MKLPAIRRYVTLSALVLFVADLPPPPPNGEKPSSSPGGCSKASQALYKARPVLYGSAVK